MKKIIVLLTVAILLTGCKKGNEKSSDTTEERGSTGQITENGEMDETTTENKEIKYDTYTFNYDITNDGTAEIVTIMEPQSASEDGLKVFRMSIGNGEKNIWEETVRDHKNETKSYWLVERDGKNYLLVYDSYYHQGSYDENYKLFSLDNDGKLTSVEEKSYFADTVSGHLYSDEDIDKAVDFYNSITKLLKNGVAIFDIDSDAGEYVISRSNDELVNYETAVISPVSAWLDSEYKDCTMEDLPDGLENTKYADGGIIKEMLNKYRETLEKEYKNQ